MADVRRGRPAPALRKAGVGGAEPHQQVRGAALDPSLPPVCGEHICRFQGLVSHRHPLFLHAPELLSRRQPRDPEGRPRTEDAAAEVDQHMSPAAFGHQPPPLRPEVRLRRLPVGRWSPALRRGPRGCPGVPLPSVSHVSLRLLCQCTAGLFVAVGHSQTKKWTVPRALWDLEFFVQGHCHVPLPVYFLHGQQCSISDVVSGSPACLPACLPACRLPSLLHDVVVISHAGEALLVYSDREPQL
ncbi:uncharacterized protein LOC120790148 isoform X13 [Xiphias gladius]|nr:uncharacterized protein LOC120790148 isoform X13 [Xiphias gladius]XP_039983430.1 uncharacterized protein LOC120790148 isoform X13 [Xiphias gladius]